MKRQFSDATAPSWLRDAARYQAPRSCYYPFSQYGGTPVEADFAHHRVEKPDDAVRRRHAQIVYNRFGNTSFR